jgi:hypothetical protein
MLVVVAGHWVLSWGSGAVVVVMGHPDGGKKKKKKLTFFSFLVSVLGVVGAVQGAW